MTLVLHNDVDKRRVAATFEKAASTYDEHDFLQREVAVRAMERLDYVSLQARRVLDVGSGTGRCASALARRYRRASVLQCDLAWGMLHRARTGASRFFSRQTYVCADVEQLPLKDDAFDLAFANLSLQWCRDLGRAFREIHRVLEPGGLVLFTTFGPDTLQELRAAWAEISNTPHVLRFFDMHDVGDVLVASGFAEPVMETDYITVQYNDVMTLMRDLKGIGASNSVMDRGRGLLGRRALKALIDAYESCRDKGRLPATYEVIYGHAWAADVVATGQGGGVHTFPLERLRRR
ncbi:MAG: malonyl-ACP O-methyltransferase BioC [Gammaproteobacteria bacterium]|nr:malonyl-ACP O-methyltransferase BioC [Gammaproteobacteria bacterium]